MIFYTTVEEMKKIAKEFGLYIDKVDDKLYKIYARIPEEFDTHIFIGADRTIGGQLEICEFYTGGYYVWNENIKFLDGIKTSTNHHWTSWVRPLLFTLPKRRIKFAKNLCENFTLVWKEQQVKNKLKDLQRDFQ